MRKVEADTHLSHQPFKWSLIRWDDQHVINSTITPGGPSFKVYLTELTTIYGGEDKTNDPLNQGIRCEAFYMCPASNPGKSFCNYPGYNYCAYGGCETIAWTWEIKAEDRFLTVGRGPPGCTNPKYDYSGGVKGGHNNWCQYLYLNITKPDDIGWLVGRTWRLQFWELGTDWGGLILIKKEVAP